ncbi:hypothetical protein FJTKL_05597 [Diaporthe vaccinii]|uniref:Uncharacterized protein n=1 Tax=Diaporthe vaccinii TaxID=105482 RepID=A0ABR4DU12_9PEZI
MPVKSSHSASMLRSSFRKRCIYSIETKHCQRANDYINKNSDTRNHTLCLSYDNHYQIEHSSETLWLLTKVTWIILVVLVTSNRSLSLRPHVFLLLRGDRCLDCTCEFMSSNNASVAGLTQNSENGEVSLQSEHPVPSQDSSNPNQATGWKLPSTILVPRISDDFHTIRDIGCADFTHSPSTVLRKVLSLLQSQIGLFIGGTIASAECCRSADGWCTHGQRVVEMVFLYQLLHDSHSAHWRCCSRWFRIRVVILGSKGDCSVCPLCRIVHRSAHFAVDVRRVKHITCSRRQVPNNQLRVPLRGVYRRLDFYRAELPANMVSSCSEAEPHVISVADATPSRGPDNFDAPIFMPIGVGLATTFSLHTPTSHWIGYEILIGIGIGAGFQQARVAAQVTLPAEDLPLGVAAIFAAQFMGGAVMALGIPGLDPGIVVATGATEVGKLVSPNQIEEVLAAYNDAIMKAFQLALIQKVPLHSIQKHIASRDGRVVSFKQGYPSGSYLGAIPWLEPRYSRRGNELGSCFLCVFVCPAVSDQ